MEKLIFRYSWGDGYTCGGTDYIPFEYKSKDKFVFDMLEKFKDHPWKFYGKEGTYEYRSSKVEIFKDVEIDKFELENIESDVFTLEEWFNENKIIIIQIFE
jgi:hypothetical protein